MFALAARLLPLEQVLSPRLGDAGTVRSRPPLILDLRLGPVIAAGGLVVPPVLFIFEANHGVIVRCTLLRCRTFRGRVRILPSWERLGEHITDFIRPTTIVLDHLVRDACHGRTSLLHEATQHSALLF